MRGKILPSGNEVRQAAAEVLYVKGALRWFQRRLPEARELLDEAMDLHPELDSDTSKCTVAILRGNVRFHMGEIEGAIDDFKTALRQLGDQKSFHLRLSAYHGLAGCLTSSGRDAEAAILLPRIRGLADELGDPGVYLQIQWLEGLIEKRQGRPRAARRSIRAAHDGFSALGQHIHAAVSALDLAALDLEEGRDDEAMRLVTEALSIAEPLQLAPEITTSLHLLQRLVESRSVSIAALRKARTDLQLAQVGPAVT